MILKIDRSLIALTILSLVNCKNDVFQKLTPETTISQSIAGQVSGEAIDHEYRDKRILLISSGRKKISFSVFGTWYSMAPENGFPCEAVDSGYVCFQKFPLPTKWDSIFKGEGSSVLEGIKDQTNEKNQIKIVSESSAKKGFSIFDGKGIEAKRSHPSRGQRIPRLFTLFTFT